MIGCGGLRKESGGSTQNLELNFKLLHSLKVISAGWLLSQTGRGWPGPLGERMFEEREIVKIRNKMSDSGHKETACGDGALTP